MSVLSACVRVLHVCLMPEASDIQEVELWVVVNYHVGPEPRTPARARSDLPISPAPVVRLTLNEVVSVLL